MWNLNGEKFLPYTLPRINKVIPRSLVKQKIFVDGKSTDKSVEIAEHYGWQVYTQYGKGIPQAANQALGLVQTPHFISFENDLLLSYDWWNHVPKHLMKPNVAVASGIRLSHGSQTVRKLQQYTAMRYRKWRSGLPTYLRSQSRLKSAFMWGKTLDNTIYKTEIVRHVGGFPMLETGGGVDVVLINRLKEVGYEWICDYNVVSDHLGFTFQRELKAYYYYASCWDQIAQHTNGFDVNLFQQVTRLFYSPLASLHIALTMKCPQATVLYPLLRLNALRGLFGSRKRFVEHPAQLRGMQKNGA